MAESYSFEGIDVDIEWGCSKDRTEYGATIMIQSSKGPMNEEHALIMIAQSVKNILLTEYGIESFHTTGEHVGIKTTRRPRPEGS